MSKLYHVSLKSVSLSQIEAILFSEATLELSGEVKTKVEDGRNFLEQKLKNSDASYYGINTGFGSLYNVRISEDQIEKLQSNLIQSHACGSGKTVPTKIVKIILLLKIISLSKGHSGVRLELLARLVEYYNLGFFPAIYEFGSLGASGDLAPLAHIGLTLIGKGEFIFDQKSVAAAQVLKKHRITPLTLQSKEGLALINGTQFSTAYALWSCLQAERLLIMANLCAAVSLDAFDGNISPFDERIHDLRAHKGQESVAKHILQLLDGSEIARKENKHIQDPYAFRCVPQVHGASLAAIRHASDVVETEINSVTDNPLIFPDTDAIISGGNFHAQPVGLVMDYLAIAIAELGSISERRTYQLLNGDHDLPDYLVFEPGVQSGLMITQYTAASIVNRNKILCTPATIDSIISSKGQEDHVSMAANAGTKLYEIIENCWQILAIEFLNGMQALDFRKPLKSSSEIESIRKNFREKVAFLDSDRAPYIEILKTLEFIKELAGLKGFSNTEKNET
jgi:histidine ammonia-lyase